MGGATHSKTCRSPLPIDAAFCPRCGGARPPDPTMPIPCRLALGGRRWRRSVIRAVRGGRYCAGCRSLAPADAAFCIRCAADLSPPPPPPGGGPASEAPGWSGADLLPVLEVLDTPAGAAGLLVLPLVLAAGWLAVVAAWAVTRLVVAAARAVRVLDRTRR